MQIWTNSLLLRRGNLTLKDGMKLRGNRFNSIFYSFNNSFMLFICHWMEYTGDWAAPVFHDQAPGRRRTVTSPVGGHSAAQIWSRTEHHRRYIQYSLINYFNMNQFSQFKFLFTQNWLWHTRNLGISISNTRNIDFPLPVIRKAWNLNAVTLKWTQVYTWTVLLPTITSAITGST